MKWLNFLSHLLAFFFSCSFSSLSSYLLIFPLLSHSFVLKFLDPFLSFNLFLFPIPHSLSFQPLSQRFWQRLLWNGVVLNNWATGGKIQNGDKSMKERGGDQEVDTFINRTSHMKCSMRGERLVHFWVELGRSLLVQAWSFAGKETWDPGHVLRLHARFPSHLFLIPFPYLFLLFFLYSVFFMKLSINMMKVKHVQKMSLTSLLSEFFISSVYCMNIIECARKIRVK